MATAIVKPIITTTVVFTIDEQEARALDALSGYGDEAFIAAFYEKLGKSYMKNHEAGLRRFLKSIREVVGPSLATLDQAKLLLHYEGKSQ